MNQENYKLYTADDFIIDEDFREIVRDSCSTDRLKELLEILPEKKHEIEIAIKIINALHVEKFHQTENKKHELWQQLLKFQKKQIRFRYFRYAASIVLLIGIGVSVFNTATPKRINKFSVGDVPPSDNATLILADGKKVAISSKQSTVKFSSDGSGIIVNDTSGIAQSVSASGVNQMIVPYGKRSYITLSEGTRIWLNSGSKLTFPPVFKGKTREVFLEGEALFDVAKNMDQPFYVKTAAFNMKVYGTKFNVQAYQQDPDYSIVLVEGKVSMNVITGSQSEEVFLAPNQKASLTKGDENFEITNVENTEIYTAWIEGYITFTNEEVKSLLIRVSRYYNVSIETDLPDNVEKIYGKLDLKEDLERVLDGIAFISQTKYEKQGNKYVFMSN